MLRLTSLREFVRVPYLILNTRSFKVGQSSNGIYSRYFSNNSVFNKQCSCKCNLLQRYSILRNNVRYTSQKTNRTFSNTQRNEIKRLLTLARPESRKIGGAVVLLLMFSSISISVPYFIGKLIDIMYTTTSDNHEIMMSNLRKTCFGLSILFFFGAITNVGRLYLMQNAGQRIVKRLRQKSFSAIISQEMAFFDRTSSGELINRLSSDTALVGKSITDNISDGLRACVQAVGGISLMVYTSPKLTCVALAVVPPVMVLAIFYGRFLRKISKKVQDELAESSQLAEERFSNMKTVRAFAREVNETKIYGKKIESVYELSRKEALTRALFFGFTNVTGNLMVILGLYNGGNMLVDSQITVGSLTSFLMYSIYVGVSITGLNSFYTELMKGLGASTRIWEFWDKKPLIPLDGGSKIYDVIKDQSVCFSDVCFTYPSRPNFPILQKFNLDVQSGSVTAIVGESGSGKSTIASLLLRYYDVENGSIRIGGEDIKDFNPSSLREYIGTVSQEPILFSTTIKENIAYGFSGDEIKSEDIFNAAKQANAYNFINSFPDGFDTVVGERGQMLSGGQRQRIAIARAILKNPKILLLDEATSALDAESEYLVQDALQQLMVTRTTIIIAHRLSTIKSANQIAVLHNGIISEVGSYEELMKIPDGMFKQLVEKQSFNDS